MTLSDRARAVVLAACVLLVSAAISAGICYAPLLLVVTLGVAGTAVTVCLAWHLGRAVVAICEEAARERSLARGTTGIEPGLAPWLRPAPLEDEKEEG